jgi:hypothetical protein
MIKCTKVKKKKRFYLPQKRPLTDLDIIYYAKKYKIKKFRGVFMRNTLPSTKPYKYECAIINYDTSDSSGSHWVAYRKISDVILYFDSMGNLKPPSELLNYFGEKNLLYYNQERYQNSNSSICGQLCLKFLVNT